MINELCDKVISLYGKETYYYIILIERETYNHCLDVARSLPTILRSPHTSCSKDSETIDLIVTHNLS
jgi:hypothetical protein